MPLAHPALSRRRLLQECGLLLGWHLACPALWAQTASDRPSGGFRVLRAGPTPKSDPKQEPIWTYEGRFPGPLLRVKQGEEIKIRLVNELPEATAIHWHGVRLPNGMDGAPPLTQSAVLAGASFDYRFAPPDAGTFWYHAPSPAQHVRGLSGVLIVEERESLDIAQEITLMFQDAPAAPGAAHLAGSASDFVLANGAAAVEFPVDAQRVRLRLVNASLQLLPSIRIGAVRCWVMAIDGQPTQPFMARDSQVALGPGNRIELFVDMESAPATVPIVLRDAADRPHEIARLTVQSPGGAGHLSNPPPLSANPLPERMDFRGALKMDVALGPAAGDLGSRPLFAIVRERTAMLALMNRTDTPRAVHLHGHHFRLLDRFDDGWKPFWLDTVLVPARETQRIAFVADNVGKWLIDGHGIGDARATPAGWFEVR